MACLEHLLKRSRRTHDRTSRWPAPLSLQGRLSHQALRLCQQQTALRGNLPLLELQKPVPWPRRHHNVVLCARQRRAVQGSLRDCARRKDGVTVRVPAGVSPPTAHALQLQPLRRTLLVLVLLARCRSRFLYLALFGVRRLQGLARMALPQMQSMHVRRHHAL